MSDPPFWNFSFPTKRWQGCRFVPYTFLETSRHRWYNQAGSKYWWLQGLAAWFRVKATTLKMKLFPQSLSKSLKLEIYPCAKKNKVMHQPNSQWKNAGRGGACCCKAARTARRSPSVWSWKLRPRRWRRKARRFFFEKRGPQKQQFFLGRVNQKST